MCQIPLVHPWQPQMHALSGYLRRWLLNHLNASMSLFIACLNCLFTISLCIFHQFLSLYLCYLVYYRLVLNCYAEFSRHFYSTTCSTTMLTLTSYISCRFPSTVKTSNLSKYEATPARGSLTYGKLSPPRIDTPAQPQPEVDLVFCWILNVYTQKKKRY